MANQTRLRSDPVFITSRFRSGSTALWNAFRQLDECTAYYEPFNERRFFVERARGSGVDATHVGVKDYWHEYASLAHLDKWYDEDWCRHDLYMDADPWKPDMQRFIEALIEAASGRPVLQFNRIDFRLPWLRERFPNATIVHLQREPRDQWLSTLMTPGQFTPDTPAEELPDPFYQQMWVADLQRVFPFLVDPRPAHPYQRHYLLWKASAIMASACSHIHLDYDKLVRQPADTLSDFASELALPVSAAERMGSILVDAREPSWPRWASADWFEAHEAQCEALLDDFFGRAESTDSDKTVNND